MPEMVVLCSVEYHLFLTTGPVVWFLKAFLGVPLGCVNSVYAGQVFCSGVFRSLTPEGGEGDSLHLGLVRILA